MEETLDIQVYSQGPTWEGHSHKKGTLSEEAMLIKKKQHIA